MHRSFHILTFGCQMNVNDSQWLARALRQRGFEERPLGEATVTILNTCSVREKPEQKVYNTLSRIRHQTQHIDKAFCVVAGCVAQQLGEKFFERFSHVRLVSGGDGIVGVPSALEQLFAEPTCKISLVDFSTTYPERDAILGQEHISPTAYVNIMQGCDNYCAYCIVPYTRGAQKSRSTKAVLDECRTLLQRGAREICLLGQNVNAFGQDACGDGTSFAALLHAVAKLPNLARLRFMTPHPKDFSPEVVRAFGTLECLCPHIHLPLQAGSDTTLAHMGRKYDRARFLSLVQELKKVRPDMSFTSDIIVGFPGEEEKDFLDTCSMLQEVGFRASYSFCYSDRPGTRASLLPHKIAKEIQLERLARLQNLQDRLTEAWLAQRVGQDTVILLEHVSKKTTHTHDSYISWQGRDPYNATINIALPADAATTPTSNVGLLLPVHITAAKKHTLQSVIKEPFVTARQIL